MIRTEIDEHGRCPLCGGPSDPAFRIGDRNRQFSQDRFLYRRCRGCRTLYNAEVPADLEEYYSARYHQWPEPADLDLRAAAEQARIEMIRTFIPAGRLIEIGSSYGRFARAAKLAGFEVTAIEMDAPCCDYLETTVGVTAVCSNAPERVITELPRADVIAMWHSLEHVADPWTVTAAVASSLAPGGVLALAMPNPQSVQFRLLGSRWVHVDAPRHLFLIPFPALVVHLAEHGLHLRHVTCDDPNGQECNRFGWERAIPRRSKEQTASRVVQVAGGALTRAMRPLERRPLAGAAYTAIFAKTAERNR